MRDTDVRRGRDEVRRRLAIRERKRRRWLFPVYGKRGWFLPGFGKKGRRRWRAQAGAASCAIGRGDRAGRKAGPRGRNPHGKCPISNREVGGKI